MHFCKIDNWTSEFDVEVFADGRVIIMINLFVAQKQGNISLRFLNNRQASVSEENLQDISLIYINVKLCYQLYYFLILNK